MLNVMELLSGGELVKMFNPAREGKTYPKISSLDILRRVKLMVETDRIEPRRDCFRYCLNCLAGKAARDLLGFDDKDDGLEAYNSCKLSLKNVEAILTLYCNTRGDRTKEEALVILGRAIEENP